MDRRGSIGTIAVPLIALLLTLGGGFATAPAAAATAPSTVVSVDPVTVDPAPAPPNTVSDFYPDQANLSDCLGSLERPGCGSKSRGGSGQTAVFVLLMLGMGIIFWRITIGVRRNRAGQ